MLWFIQIVACVLFLCCITDIGSCVFEALEGTDIKQYAKLKSKCKWLMITLIHIIPEIIRISEENRQYILFVYFFEHAIRISE